MGRKTPDSFDTYLSWVKPKPHQAILKSIRSCTATIEREPGNKFDSSACKVLVNGKMVGYVPDQIARLIAPVIDKGEWSYTIPDLSTRKGRDDDGNEIIYADIEIAPVFVGSRKRGCGCMTWLALALIAASIYAMLIPAK